jgi:hypothetical protein
VGGEVLPTVGQDLLFGRLRPSRQHDQGGHRLAAASLDDLDYAGIRDRRMAGQHPFYVTG